MSSERKKLNKQNDILVKKLAKLRDKNICQKCFKYVEGSNAHGAHVIPVSAGNKLRWDEKNVLTLCMHDHLYWWHKNPLDAGRWFVENFRKRYDYLIKKYDNGSVQKFTVQELKEINVHLKKKIARKEGV